MKQLTIFCLCILTGCFLIGGIYYLSILDSSLIEQVRRSQRDVAMTCFSFALILVVCITGVSSENDDEYGERLRNHAKNVRDGEEIIDSVFSKNREDIL
jgi:hypothetical protein